ncbi:NAD-dependent epimerase/dehydratase family protein [Alkalibacterium olivapovliticus]|uniref:NAD-dependent epimerase/dehydratase family protein n=1 Tax=Alkalibacterium olivapovliticus TaxID=99907 RepID=A0A2T0W7J5_9LACT|nr:NAD-dependent epimerase/dehydratase family protein [Alkalibacterium olivapovliticus]
MKKVLITGKKSYIGTSVENWIMKEPDNYHVDTIDMRDGLWKEMDFSKYDVVFHVAGIAHIKETSKNQGLYYKVNRDLAYETAKKAKENGVNQFIFLSSMSVYGIDSGYITKFTPLRPKNAYGKSKVEAEKLIN